MDLAAAGKLTIRPGTGAGKSLLAHVRVQVCDGDREHERGRNLPIILFKADHGRGRSDHTG